MERIRASGSVGEMMLFFGIELSLPRGRLVWIPSDPAQLEGELPIGKSLEEIVEFFKLNGGVMFAGHPYDRSDGMPFMDSSYELDDITGIEVANAGRDPYRDNLAFEVAAQIKIKGFGGTGRREPGPGEIGAAATLILDDVFSQAELIEQLLKDDVWALEFLSDASQFGEDEEQERSDHRAPPPARPRSSGHGGGQGAPHGGNHGGPRSSGGPARGGRSGSGR
jgi:hypothetical protein